MKETQTQTQTQNQNLHTMTQLMNMSEFVKKVTQLVVSISLFSYFLISHNSSLISFLHSYNFHLYAFPYQLLTHTIDKNCMFLLCNGLLVFVAKYSGLIRSLSLSYDHQDGYSFRNMFDDCPFDNSMQETKELNNHQEIGVKSAFDHSAENVVIALEEEEEEEEEENDHKYSNNKVLQGEEDKEIERNVFIISKDEEDDEEKQIWSNGDIVFGKTVEDEEEEDGNGKLSTEELNKKFDDFIRKIKSEIRIEAQRHLILV